MASDAVGAVQDLTVAIGAAIAALEDFQLIEVGVAGSVIRKYIHDDFEDAFGLTGTALSLAENTAKLAARESRIFASSLGRDLSQGTDEAQSFAAHNLRPVAAAAGRAEGVGHFFERAGLVVAVVAIGVNVVADHRQEGWGGSLESQAGNIASLALSEPEGAIGLAAGGALVAAGAPVAVGVVGAVVVTGVVAAGVGYTVQEVVDHRKAIGHFAERMVADL
jgi:hypothetical protein